MSAPSRAGRTKAPASDGERLFERVLGPIRLPAHVLVMLGASTAAYAVVLAGVAGLQSRHDAIVATASDPFVRGVDDLVAGHDALQAELDAARAAYQAAADAYAAAGGRLDTLDAQLAALAGMAAQIDGVSRSMPSSVKLPAVRRPVTAVQSRPTTQGSTGASGG